MTERVADPVLVNLTPHAIEVMDPRTGRLVTRLPAAVEPARAEMVREVAFELVLGGSAIPVCRNRLGPPSAAPKAVPGTWYVVSRAFAEAMRAAGATRADLLVPDDAVRDEKGQVVGCRGFALVE